MTNEQRDALAYLCERYGVPFNEANYVPQFDLPAGYVAGWVRDIYVGCDENGHISS